MTQQIEEPRMTVKVHMYTQSQPVLFITEAAGLGRLRFHDLRHCHASLMLAQGTHLKVVSERLGHSGIAITANVYSHLLPGLQKEAADQFDRLIASSR